MANIVDHNKMRNDLMDGAVRTVAKFGLEGTTTRQISTSAQLNEAYIYRYFLDRNDLLEKAFLRSDKRFFQFLKDNDSVLRNPSSSDRQKAHDLFDLVWDYLEKDFDFCLFYFRYYHSSLYHEETEKEHMNICREYIGSTVTRLKKDVNVDFMIRHIFILFTGYMMSAAQKFHGDSAEIRERVFDVIYTSARQYLD